MTSEPLRVRFATPADLPALHALIERSYRGDIARAGWTHEADLLDGPRTDVATLTPIIADPAQRVLLHEIDGELVACVVAADRGNGLAYMGMLGVDPRHQADGLGRRMMHAAEEAAATLFGARRMEMTVIHRRPELIAYYERRGCVRTGEMRPFPLDVKPAGTTLELIVLAKEFA